MLPTLAVSIHNVSINMLVEIGVNASLQFYWRIHACVRKVSINMLVEIGVNEILQCYKIL